jgi:hypothetical protein
MFATQKIEKRKAEVERSIAEAWVQIKAHITRLDQLETQTLHLETLQGELNCLADVLAAFNHSKDPADAAADVLVGLSLDLARSSDDAWSGRGNDFRRARRDGYIKEAQHWIKACEFALGLS